MYEAAKVIALIKSTPGYNDKQYLLKKNENVPLLKKILNFIYDPYCKTGISTAKYNKALAIANMRGSYVMGEGPHISCEYTLAYLSKNTTGSDADLSIVANFIRCCRADAASHLFVNINEVEALAEAIVTQNLQIGVTAKTLNTVYGSSFIPTVGVMLGTKIQDVPVQKVVWPCIVTEKLDGVRRILIKKNGACRLFSRSGHEDFGLVDILEDAKYLPDNRVYDGELLAIGTFKDSVAQRQATNSLASIKGNKTGLCFNVFDMLPVEEFYAGISEDNAETRKIMLGATLGDASIQHLAEETWPKLLAAFSVTAPLPFIKSVPILGYAKAMTDVEPIVAEIWRRGGEGVMLNSFDGLYEVKRSKKLLKVKHTEEAVLEVVGMCEGTNKYEDMLGALLVNYKGNTLGVGSGFTDAQRLTIWNNKASYIGRKVEIETFGESRNNTTGLVSLNCPIFKRFVGDEE